MKKKSNPYNCYMAGVSLTLVEFETIGAFQSFMRLLANVGDSEDAFRLRAFQKKRRSRYDKSLDNTTWPKREHYHDDSMYSFGGPPRRCRTCGKDPRMFIPRPKRDRP